VRHATVSIVIVSRCGVALVVVCRLLWVSVVVSVCVGLLTNSFDYLMIIDHVLFLCGMCVVFHGVVSVLLWCVSMDQLFGEILIVNIFRDLKMIL
jgi:hypothetical protein